MYAVDEIRTVHLEITTSCNLRCPQCPRNLQGGRVNPNLPITQLLIDDIRRIFPVTFVGQLNFMYMCGTYGDALVARDTLETFRYFRSANPRMTLRLHTNGSARSHSWWAELAGVIDACIFGIDGLADTNHLYRRGSVWDRVIGNATAFIHAGGRAEWVFLAFRHNEHQIEDARRLSNELGFSKFTVKRTGRFLSNGKINPKYPVLDQHDRVEYYLEPPIAAALSNAAAVTLESAIHDNDDYLAYLASTDIDCKAVHEKMIYVTAEGLVFPCCWIGNLYRRPGDRSSFEVERLLDQLPGRRAALDAKLHSLAEIISGPFFRDAVPSRWPKESPERLRICAKTCGTCDVIKGQYIRPTVNSQRGSLT